MLILLKNLQTNATLYGLTIKELYTVDHGVDLELLKIIQQFMVRQTGHTIAVVNTLLVTKMSQAFYQADTLHSSTIHLW